MTGIARLLVCSAVLLALALPVTVAAQDWRSFPIREEIDHPATKRKLDAAIQLYFRGEATPASLQRIASVKQVQGGSKTDYYPCTRALVVALKALQERAKAQGGSALVDIVSVSRGKETSEVGKYECLYGGATVQVELRAEIAKPANR